MRKAVFSGYFGQRNAGDDAFLAVCARNARRYLQPDEAWATGPLVGMMRDLQVRPMYTSLRGLRPFNFLRSCWVATGADSVVFGGGSNFHSTVGIERALRLVQWAGRGRHFAAGVSIGPFRNIEAERACAKLLNELSFVGVRGRISYERARALAPAARIELTFDIAPLLLETACEPSPDSGAFRRGLGVALRSFEPLLGGDRIDARRRVEAIAEAIRTCAGRGSVEEVVLIDFNGHPRRGDHSVHGLLRERLAGCVPVRHLPYTGDPLSTMRAVGSLRAIIAMRLHAAVFGFCTRTPTLLLAYQEKCLEWAEIIGSSGSLSADALRSPTEQMIECIELLLGGDPPAPMLPPEAAVQEAVKNWSWLEREAGENPTCVFSISLMGSHTR
jgi:polysaccharide pyruvyl transferase WcaK-like protein